MYLNIFSTFPVLISSNNSSHLSNSHLVRFLTKVFLSFEFSNTTCYQLVLKQDQVKMKQSINIIINIHKTWYIYM